MERGLIRFLIRWVVCGLGLWIAAGLLGSSINWGDDHIRSVIIAGLVLAIINIVLRPIVVILSLPAVLVTLGLFMIVINGLMVLLASKLYHGLQITGFWPAVFAGIIIGLVNYLVTAILERKADT